MQKQDHTLLLEQSLYALFRSTLDYRIKIHDSLQRNPSQNALRDLCTIQIKLPRQIGLTTCVARNVIRLWKKPCWFSPTFSHMNLVKIRLSSEEKDQIDFNIFPTCNGLNYDCVIVDPLSPYEKRVQINQIYEQFFRNTVDNQNFMFVFIG